MTDFFISQDCHQPLLHGSKAALDLAFGLWTGGDQMGDTQGGEGTLKLRAGITVIGHGIMTKEAEAVGVHDHGEEVLAKESSKMFEVIPSGVGGDKDRAQKFAGMIIDGEQEGLLFRGRPPLVDGRIVLPEFADAGALPSPAGFGTRFGLADQFWKACSGKGGHGLAVAFETESGFEFISHELKIGRFLKWQEFLEEANGLGRPVRPMVTAGGFGGEAGAFLEEASAEPVKMGSADLEVMGGIRGVNLTAIELPEDLLEKQVGKSSCDLLSIFFIATSQSNDRPLVEGFRRPSLRSGLLKPSTKGR